MTAVRKGIQESVLPRNIMPRSAEEALQLGATYIGGGTDIMPLLKHRVRNDGNLVFLKDVSDLKGIREEDGFLSLGAGETLSDIENNALIREKWPAVAEAASVTASPQIRNIGTVGGNVMQDRRCIYFNQGVLWRSNFGLCFKTGGTLCMQIPNSKVCRAIYYSDMATALLVYDAEAEYLEEGVLHRVPLQELIGRHIRANGLACSKHLPVLIRRFLVPEAPGDERSAFYKYSMRSTIDFPLINFAVRCGTDARPAKLIAGAVSVEPVELNETAEKWNDRAVTDDALQAVCEAELKKKALLIKEALIGPNNKREMFRLVRMLFPLRHPD